jgi:hypothetical protein
MFFWNKICGLILTFLIICGISSAQTIINFQPSSSHFFIKNSGFIPDSIPLSPTKNETFQTQFSQQIIPKNFSICNYGFFCKKELAIEKATRIPLRVRLGSLQQCNYYEGK